MPSSDEYERVGNLEEPFALTKQHDRRQRQSEDIKAAVTYVGTASSLTLEELAERKPCPGCRRPLRDSEPWESKGRIYFTPEEQSRYEAEQDRYKELHGDCRAGRWSVQGSLTQHCLRCCPHLPISPVQAEALTRLFSRKTPESDLMLWRLRLYCGHIIERSAHHTHRSVQAAFSGSVRCSECGLDPSTIVDAVAIGVRQVQETKAAPTRDKRTKAELAMRVAELEQQVDELERQLTTAKKS